MLLFLISVSFFFFVQGCDLRRIYWSVVLSISQFIFYSLFLFLFSCLSRKTKQNSSFQKFKGKSGGVLDVGGRGRTKSIKLSGEMLLKDVLFRPTI